MEKTVRMLLVAALACAAACPVRAASVTLTSSSGDLTLSQALADAGATVVDLTGNAYDDIVVTGSGRILFDTDIRAYTGTNSWTASAEGIASGGAFTVTGGALTFAEGTTLNVPDSRTLLDTHGGSVAVATATGGIVGMPALVFAEGDRRGILRKSDDGKSLLLTVASGMMVIFR